MDRDSQRDRQGEGWTDRRKKDRGQDKKTNRRTEIQTKGRTNSLIGKQVGGLTGR